MSKSLKKKNHWTNKVHESITCRNKEGELGFDVKGGAENGQFPYIGEVRLGTVACCQGGTLTQDELLLEVNDTPVVGLTVRDVHAVVRHSKDPVRLKCVKQATLPVFALHQSVVMEVRLCSIVRRDHLGVIAHLPRTSKNCVRLLLRVELSERLFECFGCRLDRPAPWTPSSEDPRSSCTQCGVPSWRSLLNEACASSAGSHFKSTQLVLLEYHLSGERYLKDPTHLLRHPLRRALHTGGFIPFHTTDRSTPPV
ncbi:hypothetical protein DPEC_G00114180 [Dallia pectoralis]|uniref:Uncharacterized protein n=1 Tax=Dallia pectoralis TaxID=75939 RepID=A0ACC2GU09_DALPE|nr:hypothetical protein DPEC_G00114180 [Dallia pectoralis]